MFTKTRQHSLNQCIRFCLRARVHGGGASHQDLYTERVRACQRECVSPGAGEITEKRRGAAGCQGKDLYRAVAAAETDIGRRGMHDKSPRTGGTRLKKQEKRGRG